MSTTDSLPYVPERLINAAVRSADHAVLRDVDWRIRTEAERVRIAVEGAIRGALYNGVLALAPDWEKRLENGWHVNIPGPRAGEPQ